MAAWLHRGFTLIELMVAMTILILLLVLAMPGYVQWMSDNEIRNATESTASGLRYAQSAAITSNRNAQFVLSAAGWNVMMVDAPLVSIQTAAFNEGGKNVTVAGKTAGGAAATTVAFDALGQTIPDPANLVQVDLSMPAVASTHPLRVLVGNGRTGVKICDPDPKWVFPDPRACPP
jgi:type IV fimbrial biogenesis protein FimT